MSKKIVKASKAPKARRKQEKVEIMPLDLGAFEDFAEAMRASYPAWSGGYWKKESIQRLISLFPAGQFGVFVNGKIAGTALTLIIDIDKMGLDHNYVKVTGNYTFNTHDPKGNVLYGIEVFVHPEYRGMRLGRRLYEARKELCEQLNLRSVMFGGPTPIYHNYTYKLRPT